MFIVLIKNWQNILKIIYNVKNSESKIHRKNIIIFLKKALVQAYLTSFCIGVFYIGGIYDRTFNMESSGFTHSFQKK